MLYKVSSNPPLPRLLYYCDISASLEALWLVDLVKRVSSGLSSAATATLGEYFSHLFIDESTLFSEDRVLKLYLIPRLL